MSKKIIKAFIFFLIFMPIGFQAFALNQEDEEKNSVQQEKKAEVKDTLKIDFRFNTKVQDKKNHLKWKNSSKKIKDSYDALSGASVSHSTGELLAIFRDGNSKNFLAPKGLRQLFLFAVSNPKHLESDNFMAEKDNTGKIKISFTHRKTGYFIQTDEKGWLNLENGFFIKKPLAENNAAEVTEDLKNDFGHGEKASIKNSGEKLSDDAENVKKLEDTKNSEKMENPNDDEFRSGNPDKADANPDSAKKFEGKLSIKLSGGILKIRGKLNLVEYQKDVSKENSKDDSENSGKN